MKIILNNIIPFKGYKAINLFGVIFAREPLTKIELNREAIHTAQMKEMFYIFFYIQYVIEWIINLFKYKSTKEAYRNISFEKEAYMFQNNFKYLEYRSKLW